MECVSHRILSRLRTKREMPLGHISRLLKVKFKDHRDFYPLARLITGGYVDSIMTHDGKNIMDANNRDLAITLFTATFGKGEFDYNLEKIVNDGDFSGQLFFCTAKGDLYLEEYTQRQKDRISAMFVGITTGIVTALSASYLMKLFKL